MRRALLVLLYTGLITQEVDPGGTSLVDSSNGFNELIHLEILWMVCHFWEAGTKFAFNCYNNYAQLILHQTGALTSHPAELRGVTQVEPLLMVLYGITFTALVEELWVTDPGYLTPLYVDNTALYGSDRRIACAMRILMKRKPYRGYFPDPIKSLFIAVSVSGSQYLGDVLGSNEEFESQVHTHVEAWDEGVSNLDKIAKQHP